ncbi:DUF6179 domain-containing protein [Clostridium botulinum]|nr:DUF6179 domain-containing protein [Clostridium botulinum]
MKANKLKVDNYSYNDTVDDGLSPFFKEYDDFLHLMKLQDVQ